MQLLAECASATQGPLVESPKSYLLHLPELFQVFKAVKAIQVARVFKPVRIINPVKVFKLVKILKLLEFTPEIWYIGFVSR